MENIQKYMRKLAQVRHDLRQRKLVSSKDSPEEKAQFLQNDERFRDLDEALFGWEIGLVVSQASQQHHHRINILRVCRLK